MRTIIALTMWTFLTISTVTAGTAALPSHALLCQQLVDMPGWRGAPCEGMKGNNPMMGEFVTATRTYNRGEESLHVTVVSGIQARMMWSPYADGTQVENADFLVKITTIKGFPVGISYDKRNRSGSIVVQLGFQAVMAAEFGKMDWQSALKTLQALDWKAMQALFD